MKISIRFAEQLKGRLHERGLIANIKRCTGIDRHTISALLRNKIEYVSLEVLAKLSDYLIKYHGADPRTLPGALLGRDPEHFWDMLASCQHLAFFVGTRISREWQGSRYVMSSDSRLQGTLLSKIARFAAAADRSQAAENGEEPAPPSDQPRAVKRQIESEALARFSYPSFRLVRAPGRNVTAADPGRKWPKVRARAEKLYGALRGKPNCACLVLGSTKVNPVAELCFARVFASAPFESQDDVPRPEDRNCPLLFRFRDTDPQPPSFCGGLRLAINARADAPGLWYETESGRWEASVCELATSDAAFMFYAYWPSVAHAEVVCGGFSSRATTCLAKDLEWIVSHLGEPQFVSEDLQVGLYVIEFKFDPRDTDYGPYHDNRAFESNVIRLDEKVIERRLKRRPPEPWPAPGGNP